jgi:hypothetical protein
MDEVDKNIRDGILGLGKIASHPETRDGSGDGNDEEQEDLGKPGSQHAGSRDVSEGGGVNAEVSGTRNYHSTGGATGGDLGNRPE